MATPAERFLAAYNRIEKFLERNIDRSQPPFHRGFGDLVRKGSQQSPVVRHYEPELLQFAELRNAIVHDSVDAEYIIAEPHADIVDEIERIAAEISEPEPVLPRFARRVVYVYGEDSLSELLTLVDQHGFSQFPVFHPSGAFRGMLTDRGMARWLASHHHAAYISLSGVTVSEVLEHEDPADNCRFVAPSADIYQVREMFARTRERGGQKISAVLITQSGLPQTPLLGIITPLDLVGLE